MQKNSPIQLSKSTFCLLGHTNIGVIENNDELILIDSGLNSEDASQIDEVLKNSFNKKIGTIINTHSNADHAGGNNYFSNKYNCKIFATKKEAAFLENPYLESALMWGAHPFDKIRTKYFECEKSTATNLANENGAMRAAVRNALRAEITKVQIVIQNIPNSKILIYFICNIKKVAPPSLKIPRRRLRAGSSPASGTKKG